MMIIDPRGMSVLEWTAQMNLALPSLDVPYLEDPEQWREWVFDLIQAPQIAAIQPPDPRTFADWQEWAHRFNQVAYAVRP